MSIHLVVEYGSVVNVCGPSVHTPQERGAVHMHCRQPSAGRNPGWPSRCLEPSRGSGFANPSGPWHRKIAFRGHLQDLIDCKFYSALHHVGTAFCIVAVERPASDQQVAAGNGVPTSANQAVS